MRDDSKETLMRRLEKLEENLHIERLRLHRVIDNTGWGSGMRRVKTTPSFRKENELMRKIEILKDRIRKLDAFD